MSSHQVTLIPMTELEYWKEQFPDLDEQEIIDLLLAIESNENKGELIK
mgnify:CR=1 FL=1